MCTLSVGKLSLMLFLYGARFPVQDFLHPRYRRVSSLSRAPQAGRSNVPGCPEASCIGVSPKEVSNLIP